MVELLVLAALGGALVLVVAGWALVVGFLAGLGYGRSYYDRREHEARGAPSPEWTRPLWRALGAALQHDMRFDALTAPGPRLYACAPHGMLALSAGLAFMGGERRGARTRLAVHAVTLALPGVREFFLAHGCISADEDAILGALARGESVAVVIDGVRGMGARFDAAPVLAERRARVPGVVRLAHTYDIPLVPVRFEGEDALFWTWQREWRCVKALRRASYACCRFPFPTVFGPRNWFRQRPRLVTHVCAPVPRTDRAEDMWSALQTALEDTNKTS